MLAQDSQSKLLMMVDQQKGWLRRQVESAIQHGLTDAYNTVRVDPDKFLLQMKAAYGLPVSTFQGVYTVSIEHLDIVGADVIRAGMKMAATEGAGMGLGGILTMVPDLGILAAITMRTIQKLSLVYGFEFNTDDEIAELWIAAASAAGVDIGRELVEKQMVSRFVPRVIQRIAVQASADVVEKWAGRLIPVLSSVIGAGLNYYFVRAWGERALAHFREKHLRRRAEMEQGPEPERSLSAAEPSLG
jgi:EcsC protein family